MKGGIIGVYDFSKKWDIDEYYQYLSSERENLNLEEEEFQEKWDIFKEAQKTINKKVDKGEFLLFSPERIRKVFSSENFDILIQKTYCSFLVKKETS